MANIENMKLKSLIDLTDIQTYEQEIFKYLFNKIVEAGFSEEKIYVNFEYDKIDLALYNNDMLPFSLVESGEVKYDNYFKKRIDGVDIGKASQSFFVGFYHNDLNFLQILRQSFLCAFKKSGFNSALMPKKDWVNLNIDLSVVISREDIQRNLKSLIFKIDFDYNIFCQSDEEILYVEYIKLESEKQSEINYVDLHKED